MSLAKTGRSADYWLARRTLKLMTPADDAAFEAWHADSRNAADYAAAEAVMGDLDANAQDVAIQQMRRSALAIANSRKRSVLRQGGAIVAAVLAAIVLYRGLWRGDSFSEIPGADSPPSAFEQPLAAQPGKARYVTHVGEFANYTLPDGSEIALNTDSVVEVSYSPSRRVVLLRRGQALFHVAKNKNRPFIVAAGDRLVTAVGTAFDVRLDEHAVKVVLVEGRVTVDPIRRTGVGRVFPSLARWKLSPGEQLTSGSDQRVSVAVADTDRATSWRRGQIIFRDDTLATAVAEMNRYSTTPLVIEDQRVAALRISGVFSITRPDNFLAALADYFPVETQRNPSGMRVLTWGKAKARTPDPAE